MADKSNVFRVAFSNVRIPRSQSITLLFPPAMMYSALISNSSRVLDSPRLSRIGLSQRPSSLSNSKFCIFLAPTCITSTSLNISRCAALMISVTIGSSVSRFAARRSSSPSARSPWKEYGEVRGLNAPPRSSFAPAAFTLLATLIICSSLSIEQGPAITVALPPPISASPTLITVSAGWNFLFAALFGSDTLRTASTIERAARSSMSM